MDARPLPKRALAEILWEAIVMSYPQGMACSEDHYSCVTLDRPTACELFRVVSEVIDEDSEEVE